MTAWVDVVGAATDRLLDRTADSSTGFTRPTMTVADAREKVWDAIKGEAAGDLLATDAWSALLDTATSLGWTVAQLRQWCVDQASGDAVRGEGKALTPSDDAQSTGQTAQAGDALSPHLQRLVDDAVARVANDPEAAQRIRETSADIGITYALQGRDAAVAKLVDLGIPESLANEVIDATPVPSPVTSATIGGAKIEPTPPPALEVTVELPGRVDRTVVRTTLGFDTIEQATLVYNAIGDKLREQRDTEPADDGPFDAVEDRMCPGCGCTDSQACEQGCWWVNHPTHGLLCSECARRFDAIAALPPGPADPFRALVVVGVELAAGATRWTQAEAGGYLERLIAAGSHVRQVNVTVAQDGKVISFQDGHGAADLPWRGQWGGPEKDSTVEPFLDGQVTGLSDTQPPASPEFPYGPGGAVRGLIPPTTAATPLGAETARKKSNGWCVRCGVTYTDDEMPTCECAGDPPVDKTGDEWQTYLERVEALHYRGPAATPTSSTPSAPVNPSYDPDAPRPSATDLIDSEVAPPEPASVFRCTYQAGDDDLMCGFAVKWHEPGGAEPGRWVHDDGDRSFDHEAAVDMPPF